MPENDVRDPGGGIPPGSAPASPAPPGQGGVSGALERRAIADVSPGPGRPEETSSWIGAFGGLNTARPAHMIGEFECSDILNLLIDKQTLRMRGGWAAILDTLGAGAFTPYGGHRVYNLTAANYDFIAGSFAGTNRIQSSRTGAWVDVFNGYTNGLDNRVEFVPFGAAIYVLFGATGQNAQKVTGLDSFANVAWTPNPRASMGTVHKRRLWVDDVDSKGRVYLSDTDNADQMRNQTTSGVATEGGYIDFTFPPGDRVQGLVSFGEFLVIFSERSIHFVSGTNFSNFIINSFAKFGTKSLRSIQVCDNDLFFLDSNKVVRMVSASQPNINTTVLVGRPGYYIEPTTKLITDANLPKVKSAYHDQRYWLFHSETVALAWDCRELSVPGSKWTYHTNLPVGAAWTTGGIDDSDRIHFLHYSQPKLYQFPQGITDAIGGTPSISWKSRAWHFGAPDFENSIERIAPYCLGHTGALTVSVYENLSASAARTYVLTYAGGTYERQETKRMHADVQGMVLQVGLSAGAFTPAGEVVGLQVVPIRKRRAWS